MTLPGCVGAREPIGRLGGRYAKNVTICPTQACTTPNSSFGGFVFDEGGYFEGGYEGGSFGNDGAGA